MRVAIREQLAALVVTAVLCALAVVSIPTWIFVNNFVRKVELDGLALTASLKAARISSEIDLVQTACENVASRILIQQSYSSFYEGNTAPSNWDNAEEEMQSALGASGFTTLFQSRLYSRNTSGIATGLLNVTGTGIGEIKLPYVNANGSDVYLGDLDLGYPPTLYPNITYNDTGVPNSIVNTTNATIATAFPGVRLTNNGGLLLGPVIINSTFALISLTVPVFRNYDHFLLGYMTVVASASSLIDIQSSAEGLGASGIVLMVGPNTPWNRFNASDPASNDTYVPPDKSEFDKKEVHFILPPITPKNGADRHSGYDYESGKYTDNFAMNRYPAVVDVFADQIQNYNNATATLKTKNEQGFSVAVGYARPTSTLVTWAVLVEMNHSEAYAPIVTLRQILLGCVFGTAGLVLLIVIPCAHWSVQPIRRLKDATEKTILPPGYDDEDDEMPSSGTRSSRSRLSEKTWVRKLRAWTGIRKRRPTPSGRSVEDADGMTIFKIPGKVPERKHMITDELTELTAIYNAMSDELYTQYEKLDEKVAERTRELEISKLAAEAANKSKTEFIANISHELKTPLNGIMGMCAICMEDDDIVRIKQSLKTLYKSGDLLLHLLEDVLSFSKNQIGHQISLEEREFRLGDIRSQVLAIFDKQVREGAIALNVTYVGNVGNVGSPAATSERNTADTANTANNTNTASKDRPMLPALGPPGVGRLKDMCLWGDQHRILQVIINLVNNSIKFTSASGKVDVRIRCVGEPEHNEVSRSSSFSKTDSHRVGRARNRLGSTSTSQSSKNGGGNTVSTATTATIYKGTSSGTAIAINPLDPKAVSQFYMYHERSPTPPPPGAKTFFFEFEVQDTGPGIPEHMQEKVFEPFVQGDLGLRKKFGGTGLGLSICQQLATLMGGHISLKSTLGVGSTFTMRIPLKYVKDRASSTASSSLKSRPPSPHSSDGENAGSPPGPPGQPGQPSSAPNGSSNRRSSKSRDPASAVTATTASPAVGETTPKGGKQQQPVLGTEARLVGLSQPFFVAPPRCRPNGSAMPTAAISSPADQVAALKQAVANKAAKGSEGRVRVLVADDNNTNIEVVSRMLKLEDIYDVTIAKDGQEAFDLVKATMEQNMEFDVIFMDIQMPNLDGLQSTRLIRQMGYSAPIVALTAFSEESNVKECLESGMNEFLSKPIRRPALKKVLQKFATIPEEPETASMTHRSTSDSARAKAKSKTASTPATPAETPAQTPVPTPCVEVSEVLVAPPDKAVSAVSAVSDESHESHESHESADSHLSTNTAVSSAATTPGTVVAAPITFTAIDFGGEPAKR